MDRRLFARVLSLAAASLCGAPLAGLGGCGGGDGASGDPGGPPPPDVPGVDGATVFKWGAEPNPTGLRWGFWEVFNQQAATLGAMGRRPSARVGFDAWAAIEQQPGVYTFPPLDRYADTHHYGQAILGAVNVSFKIPPHHADDITDAATRRAAKDFVRAYVLWLLDNFGAAVLTIDYEIVSNYRLSVPGSEVRAQQWSAWYLEAAAVARQAAAERGKAGLLKLQPIFNGDPFKADSPIASGGAHNPWLREVVQASDYLALDTYFRDPDRPVTDATRTIDVVRFWLDEFAGDREVVVTENGFNATLEGDPRKYRGTEEQQAAYFADLLPKLLAANLPGGVLRNRLRGFHIWSIIDNVKAQDPVDRTFGLIAADGREKPAKEVVRAAIDGAERDAFHQPSRAKPLDGKDLAAGLATARAPVGLTFSDGDRFEFLRYQDVGPAGAARARLRVALGAAGNLLLCINGRWQLVRDQSDFDVDISAHYRFGGSNLIDVHATAQAFPVNQQVLWLRVDCA